MYQASRGLSAIAELLVKSRLKTVLFGSVGLLLSLSEYDSFCLPAPSKSWRFTGVIIVIVIIIITRHNQISVCDWTDTCVEVIAVQRLSDASYLPINSESMHTALLAQYLQILYE